MASAGSGTRTTALLFSFSAILFLSLLLLQAPAQAAPGLAVADLVASALDHLLDGRGVLELMATRRNMILLCHAILLLILRDAGVLGAPARRCSRSGTPPTEATAVDVDAAGTEIIGCSAADRAARPHATTRSAVVVWRRRRPRSRAGVVAPVHEHDDTAGRRVVGDVECRPSVQAVTATWAAAPVLTIGPPAPQAAEEAAATDVATKQIVLAEPPRNDDDLLDRAAVVEFEPLERPTATAADDGERDDCDDRRIAAAADGATAREQQTAGMELELELADDRRFEEFIESQRRQMRLESLHAAAADQLRPPLPGHSSMLL